MTIKVYGSKQSTCTQRVVLALHEKEIFDYELVTVDLQKGEQKRPEFLQLQPFGKIPVYQDDEVTLFESRAVVRYIAEKFPDPEGYFLYGRNLKEKALVQQWVEVESQNWNPVVETIVREEYFNPTFFGKQPNEQLVLENLLKLEKLLDIYEAHLSKSQYLAGDFYSLADLSHIPYTFYLIKYAKKGQVIASRRFVKAWFEDICALRSWQKILTNFLE
ncbi:hypothetical protein BDL97_13G092800 [Sphagnum fallax]|nr:hypothetical protein BDL97_13G092800 [Sphagnum fallax]